MKIQKNSNTKFGKNIEDLTFDDIVKYLYTPTDPASLGITRMLFGKFSNIFQFNNFLEMTSY